MRRSIFPLAILVLAACGGDSDKQLAATSKALPYLPMPPGAELVARQGTPKALMITFRSSMDAGPVADYYRNTLGRGGWSLVSDQTDDKGAIVLYATREGRPMWVRIYRAAGAPGSMVEVSGAVTDSTAAAPAGNTP